MKGTPGYCGHPKCPGDDTCQSERHKTTGLRSLSIPSPSEVRALDREARLDEDDENLADARAHERGAKRAFLRGNPQ